MGVERTATCLARRIHHRVVVRGKRSLRRAIGLGKETFHHTPREQSRGTAAAVALRRIAAPAQRGARRFQHRHRKSESARQARQQRRDAERTGDASTQHRE